METLLTFLEHAGSSATIPRDYDRAALATFLIALRGAGHAIVVDFIYEHGERVGVMRVFHYRSCAVCQRRANVQAT